MSSWRSRLPKPKGPGPGAGEPEVTPTPMAPSFIPPVEVAPSAPISEKVPPRANPNLVELLKRWRSSPWLFVREAFNATPDAWQDDVLYALVGLNPDGTKLPPDQPYDKIALKACKGPGKTCVEAWIAWWFLLCFTEPKVVATSITAENLRDNLWTEMALWKGKSKIIDLAFEWQTERIFLKEKPETHFMSARTWPKDADKTKQANTLAGIHARNTLLILDESGDIPEGVLSAGLAHHSTQGDGKKEIHITIQAGNPTRLDGSLGFACTRDRKNWFVKEITGDPNDPKRAPRMSLQWCQQEIDKWGAEFPWVLVNVFGKFPPIQDNKLLGPEQVRAAMERVIPEEVFRREIRIAGLDVARSLGGDRSVLCRRQGPIIYPFRVWRLDDSNQLVSQVAFELSKFKPEVTFVDATGIGGPVADDLRKLGYNIVMVYFGNNARDRRFADKRSEIWWDMAEDVKKKLALPNLPELVQELTGPEFNFDAKSRLRLESKEKMKERGVGSPDIADSIAVTYAEPVSATIKPGFGIPDTNNGESDYDPFNRKNTSDEKVEV